LKHTVITLLPALGLAVVSLGEVYLAADNFNHAPHPCLNLFVDAVNQCCPVFFGIAVEEARAVIPAVIEEEGAGNPVVDGRHVVGANDGEARRA
jgi:hypothetical protein